MLLLKLKMIYKCLLDYRRVLRIQNMLLILAFQIT
nr:MAG TPA: hypothetical protein [Caudoviricetes sp.]